MTSDSPKKQIVPSNLKLVLVFTGLVFIIGLGSFGIKWYIVQQDIDAAELKVHERMRAEKEQSESEQMQIERQTYYLKMLQDSLAKNPNDTSLILPIGTLRLYSGDTIGALAMYQKYTTEINQRNITALRDYAYLMFLINKLDDGIAITKKVLALQPDNQVALFNMGVMAFKYKRLDEAMGWLRKCVKADSNSEVGKNARASVEEILKMQDSISQNKK